MAHLLARPPCLAALHGLHLRTLRASPLLAAHRAPGPRQQCVCRVAFRSKRSGRGKGGRGRGGRGGGTSEAKPRKTRRSDKRGDETDEEHKVFDEVKVTVKAGDGGNGEIAERGKGKWVKNFKYRPGGNAPKQIWLPASKPADGYDGADVVLFVDPACDSLLHLRGKKMLTAPKGSRGDPAKGSGGAKKRKTTTLVDQPRKMPPLRLPVPPGTVVKRSGNGRLIKELINPGDKVVVARGGMGGQGVSRPSRAETANRGRRAPSPDGTVEVVEVEDVNWREDARGGPGEQITLNLTLRVVADVGLVGLPNAGKSSLLAALTRAAPEVAPYPFTTLMPNLGVLPSGGSGPRPVLADLPGLIEGAHVGRGLGRRFLRHLSRTRANLQVVDASVEDPRGDYWAIREELRMYNPEYVQRPHVVILNKIDVEGVKERIEEVRAGILEVAEHLAEEHAKDAPTLPAAVVPLSAQTGEGVDELNRVMAEVLAPLIGMEIAPPGEEAEGLEALWGELGEEWEDIP
ncbi:unnamed protein product [Pedinophyceae sp. YPF-701]|nr:unnamed protein product [Pedinophyceae sp. YPF-701]